MSRSGAIAWTIPGERTGPGLWSSLLSLGIVSTVLYLYLLSTLAPRRVERIALLPPTVEALPPIAPADQAAALAIAPPMPEARDCPPLFPVFFTLNSVSPQINDSAVVVLVDWLLSHPETTLVIDGHADSLGTAAANFELSRRRADAVVSRFVAARLPRKRISRRAFGQYAPVVGLPELSSSNRRVVLSVQGAADCPVEEAL